MFQCERVIDCASGRMQWKVTFKFTLYLPRWGRKEQERDMKAIRHFLGIGGD